MKWLRRKFLKTPTDVWILWTSMVLCMALGAFVGELMNTPHAGLVFWPCFTIAAVLMMIAIFRELYSSRKDEDELHSR